MKKTFIILTITITAVLLYPKATHKYQVYQVEKANQKTLQQIQDNQQKEPISRDSAQENLEAEKQNITPPNSKLLEVQFICQAPLQTAANWVHHEESCEEAAVLQALNYQTQTTVTPEQADEIILDMIDWQNENFGGHFDIYADQVKEFIVAYYNMPEEQIRIIKNATLEDIKTEISKDNPIIAPIAGEILKNPYYPYPGYHMLLITGYTEDRIITNDNGTKRGEDFSYDIPIFIEALQDAGGEIVIIDKE